jgi:DNA-directed RNA polymerase specialized sigma24 family protein
VETDSADVIRSPGTPLDRGARSATPGAADSARSVTELFTEHHLGLVRLAVLMVGDQATAEDVVQDAFEQLHRRWRSLRQQSSALDYARSAVLNGSRSVLRRRLVARRYEGRIAPPAHTVPTRRSPSSSAPCSSTRFARCPAANARSWPSATTWT